MSASRATRQLGTLAAIIISVSQILPAQPYVYSSQNEHGTTIVKRFNLRTNIDEMFLRDSSGWNLGAEVDRTQRWLFMSEQDGPIHVVDMETPDSVRLVPFTENARGNAKGYPLQTHSKLPGIETNLENPLVTMRHR